MSDSASYIITSLSHDVMGSTEFGIPQQDIKKQHMQDLRFTDTKCPHDVTSVKEVSEKGLNKMGGSQQENAASQVKLIFSNCMN